MVTTEELLANIAKLAASGNRNYNYTPTPLPTVPTDFHRDIGPAVDFNQIFGNYQAPESATSGLPAWQKALLFIDRPRAAISNILDEATDGDKSSLGSVLNRGWAGINGKENTSIGNTLNNLGWTEMKADPKHQSMMDYILAKVNNSSRTLASFVGDVGIDPLTYLTFGAGSMIKAGAKAGTNAAKAEAKALGVKATKDLADAPTSYADQIAARLKAQGISAPAAAKTASRSNPGLNMQSTLAERFAAKKTANVAENIQNAVKGAQNRAQNAIVNLDVPFTRITKQFGEKPGIFRKIEQSIGPAGGVAALQIGKAIGLTEDDLKKFYKVDNLDDLNVQQFNHLRDQTTKFDDFNASNPSVRGLGSTDPQVAAKTYLNGDIVDAPPASVSGAVDRLTAGSKAAGDLEAGGLRLEGPQVVTDGRSARAAGKKTVVDADFSPVKKAVKVKEPKKFEPSEFVQGAGGRSKVGDFIGKATDRFNARTNSSKSGLVNQGASKLRDTENEIHARQQQAKQEIDALAKEGKDLTKEQKEAIPYIIEGKFPDIFDKNLITPTMTSIAGKMKSLFKRMGDEELETGALKAMREGYFPHVLGEGLTAEKLAKLKEKYPNDKTFSELVGRASSSAFGKERKSFDTLAQVDNALAKLQYAKDNHRRLTQEQLDEIDEKIETLSKLFERDPFTALGKRYAKSIKSTAMKNLYKDLSEDGLILSHEKYTGSPGAIRTGAYEKLETAQAKALGLEEGTYINKEILDSMKRIDGVFKNEGFERLLNNVESVQNIWKTLVTSVPSHYWNNFIGNVFNNTLAGVGVKSYERASRLLKAAKNGKLTAAESKLFQEAIKRGVMHQNFYSDFIKATDRGPGSKFEKLEQKFRNNKISSYMLKKYGQPVENVTRFALFIHGLEQTGSATQAAQMVRKYLFNYNELTNADRVTRVFIPFWNWMKNNVPLQIEKLAQNPRFYKQYVALKQQSQEGQETPDFAKESYFGLGGNKEYNPNLPLNDLNGVFGNSPMDPLRMLYSGLNPVFKIPTEAVFNKNVYTGKPIDYEREYEGGFDPQAWAKYGLSQFGKAGNTVYDAASGNWLEALAKLFSPLGYPMTVNEEGG
jgi:hypothetical protein